MKTLYFILIFISSFTLSQTYHFDDLVHYEMKTNGTKREIMLLSSRSNPNVFLSILLKTDGNYLTILNDYNINSMQYLEAIPQQYSKNQMQFSFKKSEKPTRFLDEKYYKYYNAFSSELKSPISNSSKLQPVELMIFETQKRKKNIFDVHAEIEPSEINFFPSFRQAVLHGYESSKHIHMEGDYIVKKAKFTAPNNNYTEAKLLNYTPIDYTLKLD